MSTQPFAGQFSIREATPADAAALLKIYEPYVRHTAITFEITVPTVAGFRARIASITEHYPYLVYEKIGAAAGDADSAGDAAASPQVVGYAYAHAFYGREAYRPSAETSIYLEQSMRGQGLGSALYQELEKRCQKQGITNLYACIAASRAKDSHLNDASIAFHERCGYKMVGRFEMCARKFDTWYDMVYMEKFINPHN
ncbi:MAG: GNAT family N-acetyltransferase [Atopobiaceae bacterium]